MGKGEISTNQDCMCSFRNLNCIGCTKKVLAMKWQYLSQDQISGFDKYKYKSLDTSPVSNYLTHPFWNFIVEYFPKWLAPNVLTFVGWCLLLSIYLITSYYDPYFKAGLGTHTGYKIPPLWWLFFGVAQFLAHTLDGCDGKQARRTNSSSPIGELFDHGLDSSAVWLIALSLFSVFGHGYPSVTIWQIYMLYLVCLLGFFLAHWEKYNTGVLYLPWAYDTSQLVIATVYITTYFNGVGFWKTEIFSTGLTYTNAFRISVYGSCLFITFPMSIYNVYQCHTTSSGRQITVSEGFVPFVPVLTLFGMFTAWIIISPSDILTNQPLLITTALGIVFSNIMCRLIISTMCEEQCERFNDMLYPLAALLFVVPFLKGAEEVALALFTVLVAVQHVHYGICVVNELCDHLKIHCFSLKKQ